MLDRIDVKYFKMQVGQENIRSESPVDIQARCPICGDSKYGNKARLHLYSRNNSTFVNCFNGGCQAENRIMYSFLRDFYPELFDQYKRETLHNRIDNLKTDFSNSFGQLKEESIFVRQAPGQISNQYSNQGIKSDKNESKIVNSFQGLNLKDPIKESIKEPIKEVVNKPLVSPQPREKIQTIALDRVFTPLIGSPQEEYVKSRGVVYNPEEFGEFYYSQDNLTLDDETLYIRDSVIIPTYINNEIYGFYSRSLSRKSFHTFIWKNNGYKIWNYFNQVPGKVTYVFEGIFDQITSSMQTEGNIIASMGAKISDDRINDIKEICDIVFVLDSDKTGLINSLEYQKRGFSVFVPPREYLNKDINNIVLDNNLKPSEITSLIKENIFKGIQAQIKIKQLL